MRNITKKIKSKIKVDSENSARRRVVEELFYDFGRSKAKVFWINFVRGIFFGFGSVLGGTIVVAIALWVVSQFIDWFPFIGGFIQQIIDGTQIPS